VPRSYLEDFWGDLVNLAVVKLTIVQVTRHKISKIGMVCPAKPVLIEDSAKGRIFNNILYV
jgi:hypothetical protein